MKALTFSTFGPSHVLDYKEITDPVLNKGEILVEMKAIGLNFADIMRRKGEYPIRGQVPYINGYEGAGIVKDTNGHAGLRIGDRVAFADVPFSNAELVGVPLEHLVPLPDEISFETAASIMLQGLTAHFLTTDSHVVQAGETVLVHAAAGGVGQLLIQICCLLGARVIGLASSNEKRQVALAAGAEAAFLYGEDWKMKVLELCPQGVDVVYESIGTTMEASLAVTRVRGQVVLFGLAGGGFELGDPLSIIAQSKTITGGDLWDYLTSQEERIRRAKQLFAWVLAGKINIATPAIFRLAQGKSAHEFMESRTSMGKVLLVP